MTVFAHFPRKEDLLIDQAPQIVEQVRAAVRTQRGGPDRLAGVLRALHDVAVQLVTEGDLTLERAAPFLRTVSASPSLLGRVRELCAELEGVLSAELRDAILPGRDADLSAALIVAAVRTAFVAATRRLFD